MYEIRRDRLNAWQPQRNPILARLTVKHQEAGNKVLLHRKIARYGLLSMDPARLRQLLGEVAQGSTDVESAMESLRDLPFSDLAFAHIDHHRALRQGVPEVILAEPKTADQIIAIAGHLLERQQNVLITRLSQEKADKLQEVIPDAVYNQLARVATIECHEIQTFPKKVALVTAGTGDLFVAEEAYETLRMIGLPSEKVYDVGVAGIHRILGKRDILNHADAIITVAGMEGALPSVVGGLVACPVIAVPTSVGYGAHLFGIAPLFTMLTTCAAGVVVVNIDNGFGAAMACHRMLVGNNPSKKTP
jgi:pyridinium-3,5-biscarboxylic acid mononucleotide synthase